MAATYDLGRGFTLKRVFDAPPEAVYRAWTDPDHLQWFFNPIDATVAPISVDLRVGGAWRQEMVVNADTRYFTGGVYREIEPNRKLVFTWGAIDGWPKLDLDHLDDGILITIVLTPLASGTEMAFRVQLPDHLSEDAVREWMECGMLAGWSMTIDRLVVG